MPQLGNPKHEMFCHFVARGNLPVVAYVAAGHMRDEGAANALARLSRIAERIEELKPFYHKKYRSRVSPQVILRQRREENAQA